MLKESIKKFKESISKQKEQNNKKNIENLVVFLILLIITIIAINTIWGGKKEETNQENGNTSYKKLAENINNSIDSNNSQLNEYNLEENLEDILSKIAGVGKVKVLVTYSETSEVVAPHSRLSPYPRT